MLIDIERSFPSITFFNYLQIACARARICVSATQACTQKKEILWEKLYIIFFKDPVSTYERMCAYVTHFY